MGRALRLEEEREAKRVSDAIDQAIEVERQKRRKNRDARKILLLGESSPPVNRVAPSSDST